MGVPSPREGSGEVWGSGWGLGLAVVGSGRVAQEASVGAAVRPGRPPPPAIGGQGHSVSRLLQEGGRVYILGPLPEPQAEPQAQESPVPRAGVGAAARTEAPGEATTLRTQRGCCGRKFSVRGAGREPGGLAWATIRNWAT